MATINVQTDHGAAGDGVTDDTAAINDAFKATSQGDTVLIPETSNSYLVSSSSREALGLQYCADDVTVTGEVNSAGDGTDSLIKMDDVATGSVPNKWVMGIDDSDPNANTPVTGLTVEKLRLNGNNTDNRDTSNWNVYCFNIRDDAPGYEVTVRDCIFEEAAGKAVATGNGDFDSIEFIRCTMRDNDRHGFNPKGSGRGSPGDPDVYGQDLLIVDNGVSGSGTGMDIGSGVIEVDNVHCDNNVQGSKIGDSGGQPDYLRITNANFSNANVNSGWRYTGTDGGLAGSTIEFRNVQFLNADLDGIRAVDDADYLFGEVLVDNCGNDSGRFSVRVEDNASLTAQTLRSQNADTGPGLYVNTSGTVDITNYHHYNNGGGAFDDNSNSLTIDNIYNSESGQLNVPTRADVGAFSDSSTGGGGTSPVTSVEAQTTDGLLRTTGGLVRTTNPGSRSPVTIVADAEGGTLDGAWAGSTSRVSVVSDSGLPFDAVNGQYVYEFAADNGTGQIYAVDGIDNPYPKGNIAHFFGRWNGTPDTNSEMRVMFGLEDSGNYYQVVLAFDDAELYLRKNSDAGGYDTKRTESSLSLSGDTWYEFVVEWDDGTLGGSNNDITVTLRDFDADSTITQTSTWRDTSPLSGDGVAWQAYSNGAVETHFDYYHYE